MAQLFTEGGWVVVWLTNGPAEPDGSLEAKLGMVLHVNDFGFRIQLFSALVNAILPCDQHLVASWDNVQWAKVCDHNDFELFLEDVHHLLPKWYQDAWQRQKQEGTKIPIPGGVVNQAEMEMRDAVNVTEEEVLPIEEDQLDAEVLALLQEASFPYESELDEHDESELDEPFFDVIGPTPEKPDPNSADAEREEIDGVKMPQMKDPVIDQAIRDTIEAFLGNSSQFRGDTAIGHYLYHRLMTHGGDAMFGNVSKGPKTLLLQSEYPTTLT